MENGVGLDLEVTPTPSPTPSPPRPRDGTDVVVATKGTSGRRRDPLRSEVRRKGSLRRDQRTGEKRQRSGSLLGYEAKYPVSAYAWLGPKSPRVAHAYPLARVCPTSYEKWPTESIRALCLHISSDGSWFWSCACDVCCLNTHNVINDLFSYRRRCRK